MDEASSLARTVSLTGLAWSRSCRCVLAFAAETDTERLRPAYWTLLAAALLLTTWFQAWYLVWPFGVGAALGEAKRHLEVAALSLGGLLQYFVFIYLWQLVFPHTENTRYSVDGVSRAHGAARRGVGLAARLHLPLPRRMAASSAEYH